MKKAVIKNKKTAKVEKNEISELRKLAYIFGSMLLIFVAFYGIACLKMKSDKKDDVAQTIQYNKILVNNILKQNNDEYYVVSDILSKDELMSIAKSVSVMPVSK